MLTIEQLFIAVCSLIHITEMAMVANPELQKSMGAAFFKQLDFLQGAAEHLGGDIGAFVAKVKADFSTIHAKLHEDDPAPAIPPVPAIVLSGSPLPAGFKLGDTAPKLVPK